jgi:orotidine-5'-phosphate decarboxylase
VLTSEADTSAFPARLEAAWAGGCGGVVCSVHEVLAVKTASPDLLAVVPGIRLPGGDTHDQARTGGPGEALAAGADVLVVGRAVTAAPDPEAAAAALADAVGGRS